MSCEPIAHNYKSDLKYPEFFCDIELCVACDSTKLTEMNMLH